MLVRGRVVGLVAGLVLAILGDAARPNPVHAGSCFVGVVLGVAILTLLFILAAWLGDLVEGNPKRPA